MVARAQEAPTLHVAVLETQNYVVGAANAPSGLHRYEGESDWTHLGWRNVRNFGVAADPSGTIYLAAGNGVFRSHNAGASWRITTGWQITEVLDVAIDPNEPTSVYAATAHGVWRSPDEAATWTAITQGLPRPPFTQAIAVDRRQAGRVIVGSEAGLLVSEDRGQRWTRVGPADVPIRDVKQSTAAPDLWLAGTEDHGVLRSLDGGSTWQRVEGLNGTFYAVAVDPTDPQRLAAAGFATGVYLSTDGGTQWRHTENPDGHHVHSLLFDIHTPGRLWIGTVGAGVYATDDLGASWSHHGLHGAVVYDMTFVGGTP